MILRFFLKNRKHVSIKSKKFQNVWTVFPSFNMLVKSNSKQCDTEQHQTIAKQMFLVNNENSFLTILVQWKNISL